MGRCTGCGFIRQNPRLTMACLRGEMYDGSVQEADDFWGRELDREGLEDWQPKPLAAYEACIGAMAAVRPESRPKGLWLDVGASTGSLLVAAKAAGYAVGGVELGSGQVRVCRETHGFDVFHGTLREAAFATGSAEVISWRQVLEHVHEVHEELTEARRVLRDDGFLLIEVPNFGGAKFQLGRLRTALRVSRPFWLGLNIPQHIYYFTIHSLRRLLAQQGFEVVAWETYGKLRRHPSWIERGRMRVRDGLRIGNKLRAVARKIPGARASEDQP